MSDFLCTSSCVDPINRPILTNSCTVIAEDSGGVVRCGIGIRTETFVVELFGYNIRQLEATNIAYHLVEKPKKGENVRLQLHY